MNHLAKETALILKSWIEVPANFTGVVKIKEYYEWYLDGELHRNDGPAVIYSIWVKEWWLNGENYSQEEWFELLTSEQKEAAIWNVDQW